MDGILMIVHKQVIALIKPMFKVKQRLNEIFILCLVNRRRGRKLVVLNFVVVSG